MAPQFLSYVFEGQAEGSLYHALKGRRWAERVELGHPRASPNGEEESAVFCVHPVVTFSGS